MTLSEGVDAQYQTQLTAIAADGTGPHYTFKLIAGNVISGAPQASGLFLLAGDGGLHAVEVTDENGCKAISASIDVPKRT